LKQQNNQKIALTFVHHPILVKNFFAKYNIKCFCFTVTLF